MESLSVNKDHLKKFDIQGNQLIANSDLYWEDHNGFRKACEELIQSENNQLILDLSEVSFIFSAYMGTIGKLLADAASQEKDLTIRISPNLSWLFELVGFEKMIHIEVVS